MAALYQKKMNEFGAAVGAAYDRAIYCCSNRALLITAASRPKQ
jgi:hypothetical protein